MFARARQLCCRLSGAVLATLLALPPAAVCAEAATGLEAKARAIVGFALHVEWPAARFESADAPLTIAVFNDEKIAAAMRKAAGNLRIGNRPLAVRCLYAPAKLPFNHIVFIPSSAGARTGAILSKLRGNGVLTVGEDKGFLKAGGIINFVTDGESPEYRINVVRAEKERLVLDAQLLEYALPPGTRAREALRDKAPRDGAKTKATQ